MSYGTYFPGQFQRADEVVDKILRGTKPSDMPVEQPTKIRTRNKPNYRQGP